MKLLFTSSIVLATTVCLSQTKQTSNPPVSISQVNTPSSMKEFVSETFGTFQFWIYAENFKPLITSEVIDLIKSQRQVNTDTIIPLSESVSLFLPSKSSIDSDGFIPLEIEKYISSNEETNSFEH